MSPQFLYLVFSYFLLGTAIFFAFIIFFTIISNILAKVPFVPTSKRITQHVAKLAKIKKHEKVYDLGCGDGRFVLEAQKYTEKPATGYESAPLPYLLAQLRKYMYGSNSKISMKNFFGADLSDADVIYCYLGPDVMNQVGEKIKKECRKGTRVYSNSFSIQHMKPAKVWEKDRKNRLPKIYLYTL